MWPLKGSIEDTLGSPKRFESVLGGAFGGFWEAGVASYTPLDFSPSRFILPPMIGDFDLQVTIV